MAESEQSEPGTPATAPKGGSFGGNVLKLTGGAIVAQAITVLTAPIISRVFPPELFGTLNVFTSIVSIVGVLICLRYEPAVLLPERDEDAANLLAISLGAALAITATSLLFLVLHEPVLRLLKAPGLASFLWMLPLALAIHGVYQATFYWNARRKKFGRLSVSRVAASATTSALPIVLGVLGQATAGVLIATWVAGSAVATVVSAVPAYLQERGLFLRSIRLRPMLDKLKRYRKFPLIDSWGSLANMLSLNLPVLMLSAFFTQTTVGYYSQSYRFIVVPLSLLGDAIGKVFFQRAAELRKSRQELARTVEMVFQRLVALGLFPSFLVIAAGPELFSLVLGKQWAEAGVYAQILGLWMFFLFVSWPLSNLFFVLERQELALVVNILILITRAIALVVGGVSHNIYLALGLWTGTGVLIYGGLALWTVVISGVSWRSAGRILLRYTLYALPALVILLPLKVGLGVSAWVLSGAAVLSLVGYYLWLLHQDPALRGFVFSLVSARIGAGRSRRTLG